MNVFEVCRRAGNLEQVADHKNGGVVKLPKVLSTARRAEKITKARAPRNVVVGHMVLSASNYPIDNLVV